MFCLRTFFWILEVVSLNCLIIWGDLTSLMNWGRNMYKSKLHLCVYREVRWNEAAECWKNYIQYLGAVPAPYCRGRMRPCFVPCKKKCQDSMKFPYLSCKTHCIHPWLCFVTLLVENGETGQKPFYILFTTLAPMDVSCVFSKRAELDNFTPHQELELKNVWMKSGESAVAICLFDGLMGQSRSFSSSICPHLWLLILRLCSPRNGFHY